MITLLIPYFGSLPPYFQLYLNSLAVNCNLIVVLITDIDLTPYQTPSNLIKVEMTIEQLRVRIQQFLLQTYGKSSETLISTPYKLVDFKIMYPLLFEDLYGPTNHVGWGDIDVIYGNLDSFITDCDIIGGYHGHFTAIRNIKPLKSLFLTVPKLYDLCIDTKVHITDEIAFRQPLEHAIKTQGYTVCHLNASFCDIVPPRFFGLFRSDFALYTKNFFNVMKPLKNISYVYRDLTGLTTVYDDGEIQPTSYVHLQKRVMNTVDSKTYYITENMFNVDKPIEEKVIPAKLFMTWPTTPPPLMQENIDYIVTNNPDISVHIYDDEDCENFLSRFPPEVLAAFRCLKPGAYKADLWRLCILYTFGGIYMDIKLKPQIPLSTFLTREYFVLVDLTQVSVYNGFMVSKPQNPLLLRAIVQIVLNVKNKYYGETPWCPTGPRLLGPIVKKASNKEPLYMAQYGPKTSEHIKLGSNIVFVEYPGYRSEYTQPYYVDLWNSRDIYQSDLNMTMARSWPAPMLAILDEASKGKIRLHLPAIPYTITNDEFSHDAFTGKVKRFSRMLQKYEVIHYGIEGSDSGGYQIDLMTKAEWNELRVQSLMFLDKSTREAAEAKLVNPKTLIGVLANYGTPLFIEFNKRLKEHLQTHYRNSSTDIVCIPLGHSYDSALLPHYTVVETGIGYKNSHRNYRIFESYSWMSKTLGEENKWPNNYWFVIPHSFDSSEFSDTYKPQPRPRIGFLGRIVKEKGCGIIAEVAKRFPQVDFVLCGQGDPRPYLTSSNITYKLPIHGLERSDYLGSCVATMCPTTYLEPFGCSAVESQLCGTPVITVDNGAYVETVEQFKTGLRCHTLADFCRGVQMALDGKFDRKYVRERAVRLYDMHNVAPQYDYVFESVLDIHRPSKNGWYSPDCHLSSTLRVLD
jgi:mannosyltransferase OCH1-like enzyme/glycosyltransferase involved in cell wall biosynthesis